MLILKEKVVTETYEEDGSPPGALPPRGKYVHVFGAVQTLTLPGTLHGLGTADLVYAVYSAETPAHGLSVVLTVDPLTFDVVIMFTQPQAGRVVLLA